MEEFLGRWMPVNASAHGPALDSMTALVHWVMALLFVGWGVYFLVVLFRFRQGKNRTASYSGVTSHFSTWIEVGVVVVEAILLVGFAIPAWARWVSAPAPDENPLRVRVVAQQFAWNIHYPGPDDVFGRRDLSLVDDATNPLGLDREDQFAKDDVVTLNQLHLPVDRAVTVLLSSKDVIHSFSLPVMRVKQDAIPGMEIPVQFKPVMVTPEESRLPGCANPNDKKCWEIACAQLCGLTHYRMIGYLTVHLAAEFDVWMAEQVAAVLPAEVPAVDPEPVDAVPVT